VTRAPRAPAPGAKTARGLATQAALVQAAQKVFERDGFLDARIADITATARTATGSFYTYFEGKEEIFAAVVDALNEEGLHPPSLEFLADDHADLVAEITEHHRAPSRQTWHASPPRATRRRSPIAYRRARAWSRWTPRGICPG
jgi:AcrR family transcriptional regulator